VLVENEVWGAVAQAVEAVVVGYASVGEVNGNEGPVGTVVDWDEEE